MSRIILERYHGTDESRLVVGWDRPCQSYYWQEFNKEPTGENGEVDWDANPDWEEMLGYAGYMLDEFPTLGHFEAGLPSKFKPYFDNQLRELLTAHSMDADTGSVIVDLSKRSWKIEVKTSRTESWATNGIRFATKEEAEGYAIELTGRWTSVQEYRVSQSGMPVNYKWENGRAVSV